MLATDEPSLGLRDRQRRETHLLIRRTAYDLALEHGVSAVSVSDISHAAGISPRTFFNHFRSKEEALIPDLPGFSAGDRKAFVEGGGDLLAALEALLGTHVCAIPTGEDTTEGPMALKRLVDSSPELLPRALAVFEAFELQVAGLVAERTGRAPDDLFCTVTAGAAAAAVRAAIGSCSPTAARQRLPIDVLPAAFAALREALRPTG